MSQKQQNHPRFIRLGKPVQQLYGISRSTQYNLVKDGKVRPPRKISPKIQGWLVDELEWDLFDLRKQEIPSHN
jgi:predicted DNA-binding transcriptional regulator AlpA